MTTSKIAIVGLACRFPGIPGPREYWELLCAGGSTLGEVPASRWDLAAAGYGDLDERQRQAVQHGGFFDEIDSFDAEGFGISRREAQQMDPQHRFALEVADDAFRSAGWSRSQLRGTKTGVYLGICNFDYVRSQLAEPGLNDGYVHTGGVAALAANRISHVMDLRGPSISVDTACSSSLVAVHLACQALAAGDATQALVGGVNLIVSPELSVTFARSGFLSPQGSRAFAEGADGYTRGEGVGFVVLKPLSAALNDGDPIWAVIGGSAVNQDGGQTLGITAPSGPAQAAVVGDALIRAGHTPRQVAYLEAHGTGTALGDWTEANSISRALGKDRPVEQPLCIGSAKSNLGHLEAAAGIAGLIKTTLAIHHGSIPPTIRCEQLNSRLCFEELGLHVQRALGRWPMGPRIAGVSAFSFGGTNCHVIVESAPPRPAEARPPAVASPSDRERQSYWYDQGGPRPRADGPDRRATCRRIPVALGQGQQVWEIEVGQAHTPWLEDHRVQGAMVFPAAGYLALLQQIFDAQTEPMAWALTSISLRQALLVAPGEQRRLQIVVGPQQGDRRTLEVSSTDLAAPQGWTLHLEGAVIVGGAAGQSPPRPADLGPGSTAHEHYAGLATRGNDYGPRFRAVRELWPGDARAVATVSLAESFAAEVEPGSFHPAVLDAVGQVLVQTVDDLGAFMPTAIERVSIRSPLPAEVRVLARRVFRDRGRLRGDVFAYADDGTCVVELWGVELRELDAGGPARPSPVEMLVRTSWPLASLPQPAPEPRSGCWLVVGGGDAIGRAVGARLRRDGVAAVVVERGTEFAARESDRWCADLGDRTQLARVVEAANQRFGGTVGVIHLEALAPFADVESAITRGAGSVLALVQALADDTPCRVVVVTRDAVHVAPDDRVSGVLQSAVHGLVRTVQAERRHLRVGVLDLDRVSAITADAEQMWAEATGGPRGEVAAIRAGRRHVARLARLDRSTVAPVPVLDRGATYLITGGLGGLGLRLAQWMVEHGARRMVLLGRTALPARARWDGPLDARSRHRVDAVLELERAGATVRSIAVDLRSRTELQEAMRTLDDEGWPALRGVVHAAGTLELQDLDDTPADGLHAQQAAKIEGAWALHEALGDTPLDFFVLYSSLAAVVPSRRQGAYAMANAVLDGLAAHRRAAGRPGLSIGWPAWRDLGMAAQVMGHAHVDALTLEPHEGLAIFGRLLADPAGHVAVVPSPLALSRLLGDDYPPLEALLGEPPSTPTDRTHRVRARLMVQDDPDARLASVVAFVRQVVARVLRVPSEQIDPSRSLIDLGVDSLLGHEVAQMIERELGVDVPVVRIIEGPAVDRLAGDVLAMLDAGQAEPTPESEVMVEPGTPSHGQAGLWFLHRQAPDSAAYNVAFALRLHELDRDAFRRAFEDIVARHPALRTAFDEVDGAPRRRIEASLPVGLDVEIDLCHLSPEAIRDRLTVESERPFDLFAGPLFRLTLHRISATEHALLLAFHHAIIDFWSLVEITRELGLCYRAHRTGQRPGLAPVRRDYADFVQWQRRLLEGERGRRLREYWSTHLRGVAPVVELPTDRPRPPHQTFDGATCNFSLAPELAAELKTLARQQGVTLYTALLAIFEVLIAKLARQSSFAVGTLATGRTNGGFGDLVGYFVNLTPVRAEIDAQQCFVEHLARVRDAALGALEHQDYPFVELVRELGIRRDPSRAPLCQTLFVLQKAQHDTEALGPFIFLEDGEAMDLGGLVVESMGLARRTAQYDLLLVMLESRGAIRGQFQYNTDLFDAASVRGFAHAFEVLVQQVVAKPDATVASMRLMPVATMDALRAQGESSSSIDPRPDVVQRWRARVERSPDAIAVRTASSTLRYRELADRVDRLAARLLARGVSRGDVVGVAVERSAAQIVAVFAVATVGAAYLPLDPSHPPVRIDHMLADADATVVLGRTDLLRVLQADHDRKMDVDPVDGGESVSSVGRVPIDPDDLAYVLYTSGSTGAPKGVAITHRGLANHMAWIHSALELEDGDRVSYKTPVGFDASVWELWAPLLAGACVVVASPGLERDPDRLAEHLAQHGVTVVQLVPRLLRAMLACDGLARCGALRWVLCGGEPLDGELRGRVHDSLRVRLGNLYGPTEATIDATFWEAMPHERDEMVPIGRPVSGMAAHVVDPRGMLCEPGRPGELWLAGPQLARGYVGREATDDRFVPNPFGGAHRRIYRTGDAVVRRDDGVLCFLGRIDDQIKVNGARCEPAEVEASLRRGPGVAEAAVVLRGQGAAEQLFAFVTAVPGAQIDGDAVRRHCSRELPPQVVPSRVITVAQLPQTPSGKVDRPALRVLPLRTTAVVDAASPHALGMVGRLQALWGELLGRDDIGGDDDFFDLGGHSLMAMAMAARLGAWLGTPVSVQTIFEAPTIRSMAARLGTAQREAEAAPLRSPQTLWMPHPSGDGRDHRDLADALGELGLHTLTPYDPHTVPPSRIDLRALAECCVGQLRERQPQGPYVLAGWSLGGTIAWEMAAVLGEAGAQVQQLVLIDSVPFFEPSATDGLELSPQARFEKFCGQLSRAGTSVDVTTVEAAARAVATGREPPACDAQAMALWRSFSWADAMVRAAAATVPTALDCPVAYVRPTRGEGTAAPWAARVRGEMLQTELLGDHHSVMYDAGARATAAAIEELLQRGCTAPPRLEVGQ